MSFALLPLTCDQALFSFRWVKHSGGEGETKNRAWYNSSVGRLLPTFFIDWHPAKQPIKISAACTILGMQIFAKSHANVSKIKMKSQATIYFLGTCAQIYNLKVLALVLYMVALSWNWMKIQNKTRLSCTKICCILESFLISGGIWKYSLCICHRFFCIKNPWEIKRNTFSFIL